jgi:hypothetical protein
MIKEFNYTSSKGTNVRKVFVIKEGKSYLEGIDLTLLSEEDASLITERYKDFIPVDTNNKDKILLDEFNTSWNKAYRRFVKCKINS